MPVPHVNSESMVAACLERIAARDGELKAWVHVAGDAALAQARALDKEPARGLLHSPLHGVPVGIKDVFDTADMPTEYNSAIYAGHRPRADAARRRAAAPRGLRDPRQDRHRGIRVQQSAGDDESAQPRAYAGRLLERLGRGGGRSAWCRWRWARRPAAR